MEIDVKTVHKVFCDILEGRMSREAADHWAFELIKQEEARTLTYSPKADKPRIWAGIMYLFGVDIMTEPGVYLHTDEDMRLAMFRELDL